MASSSGAATSSARRQAQIDALLAAPTEAAESAYYARLTAALGVSGDVAVRRVQHGKGLVAARDFAEGDRVLVEPPLVGMQHERNRRHALVCGQCFRYVGAVEHQIARRLLADDADADADAPSPDAPPRAHLEALRDGRATLPLAARFAGPAPVPCRGGCAREAFCSPECESAAWRAHERVVCVGRRTECRDGPANAEAFVEHARATNDVFILVARLINRVAADAEAILEAKRAIPEDSSEAEAGTRGGDDDDDGEDGGEDALVSLALAKAWEPFAMGAKCVWWEGVARPEDVPEGAPEAEFRASMRDIAEESLRLLERCAPPSRVAAFPALFSLDVFGRVVGMFERNNLEIAVASPVEDYFLEVDALDDGSAEKEAALADTAPLLDALDLEYDAPLEGSGFFALQSCCNSDCDPNVAPRKDDGDDDGRCVLIATRAIRAGEELTMCYVDETADVRERRAQLMDYGFECACETCERDAATLAKNETNEKEDHRAASGSRRGKTK
jgi:hypothetical protein